RKIANASHPADHRNLRQIAKRGSAACVEEAASQGARNLLSERSDIREVAQAMPGGENRMTAPPATEATDLPPAPVIAPSPASTATTSSLRQAPTIPCSRVILIAARKRSIARSGYQRRSAFSPGLDRAVATFYGQLLRRRYWGARCWRRRFRLNFPRVR